MKNVFFYSLMTTMTLVSCGDGQDDIDQQIEAEKKAKETAMMISENAEPDILKPSTLMTLSLIRELFNISKDEFIDFSDTDGKCAYDFVVNNKSHHVDLLFYFPGEMDDEKATKMYDQLTTKYTKPEDAAQTIEGIADKAIWSTLGGGQMIARYKNEIIILNMSVIDLATMTNLGMTDKNVQTELISKAKKIMEQVIFKLENNN